MQIFAPTRLLFLLLIQQTHASRPREALGLFDSSGANNVLAVNEAGMFTRTKNNQQSLQDAQDEAQLLDGCSSHGKLFTPWGSPRMESRSSKKGEAICWSEERGMATRNLKDGKPVFNIDEGEQILSHDDCSTPTSKKVNKSGLPSYTYEEAKAVCEDADMRLCQSQEELDASCGTGCNFNFALAWVEPSTARLVDGCSNSNPNYAPWGVPRMELQSARAGEAICWSEEKGFATRNIKVSAREAVFNTNAAGNRILSHSDCSTPGSGPVSTSTSPSYTYADARAICRSVGLRLCKDQTEMDNSCGTGCHFNFAMAWLDRPIPTIPKNSNNCLAAGSQIDLSGATDFKITATINTVQPKGTIFGEAFDHGLWKNGGNDGQGKMLFLRNRKLCFDIGYVGVICGTTNVADGEDHEVALEFADNKYHVLVGGKRERSGLKSVPDHKDASMQVGTAIGHSISGGKATCCMAPDFVGTIENLCPVTCTCETPGRGTVNVNGYTCNDGVHAFCAADEECFATKPFKKGSWTEGCRKATTSTWRSTYYLRASDADTYIHASGGTKTQNAVTMHTCPHGSNHPNCQWSLVPSPTRPGHYYIKASDNDTYIHANGGTHYGHAMTMHPCPRENDHPNCQWSLVSSPTRPGHYYIKASDRDLFLHSSGGTASGSSLTMHTCPRQNDHPNCQFSFVAPDEETTPLAIVETEASEFAGVYEVWYRGSKRSETMTISCNNGLMGHGGSDFLHFDKKVMALCDQARDDSAKMYILDLHGTGKYECLRQKDDDLVGSHYTGPDAFWGTIEYRLIKATTCQEPITKKDGLYYLKASDKNTDIHSSGGTAVGSALTMHLCPHENRHSNCQWSFVPSETRHGYYYIKSSDNDTYIHADGGAHNGKALTMHPCPGKNDYPNCQWAFVPSPTRPGSVYLKASGGDTYIHANGGTGAGNALTMHPCPRQSDHANCQFAIEEAPGDRLLPNQRLDQNERLVSTNGDYTLIMQGDGNLVAYAHAAGKLRPIWNTGTNGKGSAPYMVYMQGDSNFVVYGAGKQPIWASGTLNAGGLRLVMQDDGNVVMYADDDKVVWSSGSVSPKAELLDGCSQSGGVYKPWGEPRKESQTKQAGEAICWSEARGMATRNIKNKSGVFNINDAGKQILSHADCSTTDSKRVDSSDSPSYTYQQAKGVCEDAGMRLCQSQEELDASCGTGCHFDAALSWLEPATAWLLDGCSTSGSNYKPWGDVREELQSAKAGEAICWSDEKGMATRNIRASDSMAAFNINEEGHQVLSHEECSTPNDQKVGSSGSPSYTYEEAKKVCEDAGLRLCQTQAELDSTCGTGCHFNFVMAWLERPEAQSCKLLTDVAGTTNGSQAFWASQCSSIPDSATMIRVDMGAVTDFFKPVDGSSLCDMLQSKSKHLWSAGGHDWEVPAYYGGHLGGSQAHWPRNHGHSEDQRTYLSFWGSQGAVGGCCHASLDDGARWGLPFSMYTCTDSKGAPAPTPAPPPPPTLPPSGSCGYTRKSSQPLGSEWEMTAVNQVCKDPGSCGSCPDGGRCRDFGCSRCDSTCTTREQAQSCCLAADDCTAVYGGGAHWWTFHHPCEQTHHDNSYYVWHRKHR